MKNRDMRPDGEYDRPLPKRIENPTKEDWERLQQLTEKYTKMEINQYDKVLLKDGSTAYIVEIFEPGKAFLADIDKDGDTYTEDVTIEDIEKVVKKHLQPEKHS